jgi:hypothetical protein
LYSHWIVMNSCRTYLNPNDKLGSAIKSMRR